MREETHVEVMTHKDIKGAIADHLRFKYHLHAQRLRIETIEIQYTEDGCIATIHVEEIDTPLKKRKRRW